MFEINAKILKFMQGKIANSVLDIKAKPGIGIHRVPNVTSSIKVFNRTMFACINTKPRTIAGALHR